MKIALVVSEFNNNITSRMLKIAHEKATALGMNVVHVSKIPGAYDMPLIVDALLARDDIDGVVTLGAIIHGQTKHDEVIAHSTASQLSEISVKYHKPVSFGVTGPGMQERQAFARIRPVAERAVNTVLALSKELHSINK